MNCHPLPKSRSWCFCSRSEKCRPDHRRLHLRRPSETVGHAAVTKTATTHTHTHTTLKAIFHMNCVCWLLLLSWGRNGRVVESCTRRSSQSDAFIMRVVNHHNKLEECKLTPTLTFDLLTSNKLCDQDLSSNCQVWWRYLQCFLF